jgi:dipeptidyl aminopeptidase/acylaminoacyl peptidase
MWLLRRHTSFILSLVSVALIFPTVASGQPGASGTQRPMTPQDLWALGRVGAPTISPDGNRVAYTVTRYDVEANRGNSDIWVVPFAGGEAVRMTSSPGTDAQPAWSPDGKWLAFVSTRGGSGPQIYLLPANGGEAKPLTSVAGGASSPAWSRDGSQILFISEVWPEGDEQATRLKELAEGPTGAKVYDELMYRHWDVWEDGLRSHVFLVDAVTGESKDLTPGPYDTPPISLGGFQDFDLSPDGSELAFVRNTDVPTAVGTGNDIWLVSTGGGEPRLLTESDANDTAPQYSPDGRYLAYTAMERPGFEADRTQLILYDRRSRQHRSLTADLDRSVAAYQWAPDGQVIYFLAQDRTYRSLYRVRLSGGAIDRLTEDIYLSSVALSPDGSSFELSHQSNVLPTELYAMSAAGGDLRQLTATNEELLGELSLQPAEIFTFRGAGGTEVEGFLVRPPGFEPGRKYPLVYLVHGGPQGAWSDVFHYRWNANMFAAPGYVVVAVNPRGSTGYGQQFTDEITGDWGGKVYEDLMRGLDHALATYDFIDEERIAAAGASYGGYMMNWFEGHTTRFRTLVNHDGVANTISMYGSTEELWFPEWEFRGTPWDNPRLYRRWNPMEYVEDFQTPMLIIHGGLDYRVPLGQGLEMFTALRRKGIRSRLLYFPDEGHWVLRPQNAMVWWTTIYEWLAEYLKR